MKDGIGNAKKDSVIIPRLQVSLYSRDSALQEEGTASEDGGWRCKISESSLAEQSDKSSWVSVVCVIEGQCFARRRDSLRGRRMAM